MNLTSKQKNVLSVIRNITARKGVSPTLREIQECLGYTRTSSVQRHTEALKKKGFLKSDRYQSRGLTISNKLSKKANIPLVGSIACGKPMLAVENIEAYIPYEVKGDPKEYFFLRAIGDSMNKAGINNGNLVLIKKQPTADPGDKIVALIGDEATIKVLKRGKDCLILEPKSSNSEHKPIYILDDILIQGIVKKVINNKKNHG